MFPRCLLGAGTSQHAGNLVDPLFCIEFLESAHGRGPLGRLLFDPKVMMPASSDLRQMGHTEHLPIAAQIAQHLSDGVGDIASDSGIDLIEHQGGDAAGACCSRRDGQADPGKCFLFLVV